jgi:hypothetical protein
LTCGLLRSNFFFAIVTLLPAPRTGLGSGTR